MFESMSKKLKIRYNGLCIHKATFVCVQSTRGHVITSTDPVALSVCVHVFVQDCGIKMAADCATTQQAEQHDDN